MKTIGIIGSGTVAKTLTAGFVKYGYKVLLGNRTIEKVKKWADGLTPVPSVGTIGEVIGSAEIIVLATKGQAAAGIVKEHAGLLKGKIVIDPTNPIAEAPPENGVLKYTTNLNESLMEQLQQLAPDAYFVKAFNSVGSALMVDPIVVGGPPTMFICGNNDRAKGEVSKILEHFGWEVADMGVAAAARAIEPLAILWCIPGFLQNDWVHAFKMVRPGK